MSDDLVRAEVHAVRNLRKGVSRYSEHVRDAAAQARREVAAADRKAQEAVARRRSELQRREQEFRAAQAALARCRENCGGLQQQVNVAAQRHAQANGQLGLARKAAQLTAAAQSDLLKVLQTVEGKVGEQSSVASSALARLDAKLAELPHFDLGHSVHNVLGGIVVGAEIVGATMNLGRVTGNALAAFDVNTPVRDKSISEMVEHQDESAAHYVVNLQHEAEKRSNSGDGKETIA